MVIFIVLSVYSLSVYSVIFGGMCRHTPPHTNHTKLHYTTTKHKHTHTLTNTNTSHSHKQKPYTLHSSLLCLLTLTILLYVSCLSFFWLVFCVRYLTVCLLCISVYVYIYCCCFRYLNGVCPIRDDHCGHHQNTHTRFLIVQASWWRTTTSSSSPVPELLYCFFLRQGIASGCLSIILLVLPIAVLLLLLLVL